MTPATFVIIVLVVLVALLVAAWVLATRVKRRIDDQSLVAVRESDREDDDRVRGATARPQRGAGVAEVGDGVLRYQVGDRPMAPVAVAPGETAKALREVGDSVGKEFGAHWVAVVRPAAEDTVTVDRLA